MVNTVEDSYLHGPIALRIGEASVFMGWSRLGTLALVVGIHVLLAWALLQVGTVRQAVIDAAPIMVRFIDPPPVQIAKLTPRPLAPRVPEPIAPSQPQPTRSEPLLLAVPFDHGVSSSWVAPPPMPKAESVRTEPPPVSPPVYNADYLRNPPPVYPAQAKRLGEQGMVILKVYVSAAGLPEQVEVQTSSGSSRLDQAALNAVRAWTFVPAKQGDKPVAAWVAVPLHFRLGG